MRISAGIKPMQTRTTIAIATIVLVILTVEVWLLSEQPFWGLNSPFPFTVLRTVKLPLVIGIGAVLAAMASRSAAERRMLYSITAASVVEIAVVEVMVWLGRPALLILVLLLNAFVTFQFLRYGRDHLLAP